MKIIIPGGAGFVGRNLVRILLTADYPMENVVVIDSNPENLAYVKKYGVRTVNADLSVSGDWDHEFENADIVINLAAQLSSPGHEPFYRNNVLATKNIIDAMKKTHIQRIIHFSSAAVISLWQDDYARTKAEGERLVRESGLDYCILQPSIMYGPTDETNIGFLIKFAKKVPVFPIPGHGKWPRQPHSIDDVCLLVLKFIEDFPHNEVISVNGKETIYYKDMVRTVLSELGGFKFRVFLPIPLFILLMNWYQKMKGVVELPTTGEAGHWSPETEYNGWAKAGGSNMSLHNATQMRRKIRPCGSARDRITW